MQTRPDEGRAWPGLAMSSLVLGYIALLLFFLPVLGIPIAGCGVLAGFAALAPPVAGARPAPRWALGGVGLSLLALAVNVALYYAPAGYRPPPDVPPRWQPPLGRPFVAPPADGSPVAVGP